MPILATNAVQIARFANALYGVQLGSATNAAVLADITAAGGLDNALNSYYASSFGSKTSAQVAAVMVANLGIVAGSNGLTAAAVTDATNYIVATLNAAPATGKGAAVKSILNLWANISDDATLSSTYGAAATAWNANVAAAQAYTASNTADAAVGAVVSGQTFTLTTGADSGAAFTGSAANDTFNAVLVVKSSGAGATVVDAGTTLQAGDNLVGGAGTDTLRLSVSGVTDTTNYTVNAVQGTGIEKVLVNNFATGTKAIVLDSTLFDSALTTVGIASDGGTADTSFTNTKQIVGAEMTNGSGSLTITSIAGAVAGSADATSLALSNQTGGTFTYDGIETFNVVSNTSANTVTLAGSAVTKAVVSGAAKVTLGTLPATLKTLDASAATGGVVATAGQAVAYNITGSSGNDTVTVAVANIDVNDSIDGGSGTDTLIVDAAFTAANTANIKGFEVLASATNNISIDASLLNTNNAVVAVAAAAASDGGAQTLTFANLGASVANINVTGTEGVIATLKANTTADAVTVTYGTAPTATAAGSGVTVAGQTTLNDYETISIVSQGAANNTGTFTANSLQALKASGDVALTVGTLTGATQLASVDASGMTKATAAFIMTNNASTVASTIVGGMGNDTLIGGTKADNISGGDGNDSIAAGAGNDVVSGGAGNDTIQGEAGVDSLDGGAGNDTFIIATDTHFTGLAAPETVNGGDGTDTLQVTYAGGNTSIAASDLAAINSIETIEFKQVSATARASSVTLSDAVFTSNGANTIKVTSSTEDAALTVDASAVTAANSVVVTTKSHDSDSTNASGGAAARNDSLVGGAGNDTFNFSTAVNAAAFDANDTVSGGKGSDTLAITLTTNSLTAVTLTSNVSSIETIKVSGSGALTAGITLSTDQFVSTAATSTAAAVTTVGVVDASGMTGTGAFTFNGAAETDSAMSITGGSGADNLTGGSKADTIIGGEGADTITGGAGVDNLSGGNGDDTFVVGTLSHFTGLASPEIIDGGAGNDTLSITAAGTINSSDLANVKNVEILSVTGASSTLVLADTFFTNAGVSSIKVTGGDSFTLNAAAVVSSANAIEYTAGTGAANDTLTGGAGNDTFKYTTATNGGVTLDGNDVIAGGAGTDTLALTVTDSNGSTTANRTTIALTNVSGIEAITVVDGTATNDAGESLTLTLADANFALGVNGVINASGTANGTYVDGSAEADTTLSITGGSGADSLTGGSKADVLVGNAGNDTLTGGAGADVLTGGIGADVFVYAAASQSGGTAVDTITDFVNGTDKINVTLNYSAISSTTPVTVNAVRLTAASDLTTAQSSLSGARGEYIYDTGASRLYINVNADNLVTSSDYTIGVNPNSTATATVADGDVNFSITGTAGADTITAGGGADTINGNTGADVIRGGGGADAITITDSGTGSANSATVKFEASAAANGADTITGFKVGVTTSGGDVLDFSLFGLTSGAALDQTAGGGLNGYTSGTDTSAVATANKLAILLPAAALTEFDTAAEVASEFGAGKAFSLAANSKAIIISTAAGQTTAYVWFVTNDATAAVAASEVALVGTITLSANYTDGNLVTGNFAY